MSAVEKMTVALTPELASYVRGAVAAGDYASNGDVIREAIREWHDRHDLLGYTPAELGVLAQAGIDSGPSRLDSLSALKAEARRRFETR
jgi:antitoxin ParD1/3/4